MKIAILGASGEIGARLAQIALLKGMDVRLLVRSVDPRMARWGNADIRKVDLSNTEQLTEALAGVEAIINCAIDKSSTDNEDELLQRNVKFFTNLLDTAIALNIGKFVDLSSIAVMPPRVTAAVLADDYTYSTEADWYTNVKIATEKVALTYQGKLDITVIRPGIVYGPYMHWSRMSFNRLQYYTLVLPKAENSMCHAIYVDDLADLTLFTADKRNNMPGLVYGINPQPVSWQEYYNLHAQYAGDNKVPTRMVPLAELQVLQKVEGDELRKPGFKRSLIDFARKMFNAMPGFITRSGSYKKLIYKLKAMNYGLLNYDNYLNPPKVVANPLFVPNQFEIELYMTDATPTNDKNGIKQGFVYKTDIKTGTKHAANWWKYRL